MSVSEYTNKAEKKVLNCTFKDVSHRKQAELNLQFSERKYREQFENSLDGIILAEKNGSIYDANPTACAMLGYSYDELVYQKRETIIDPTDPFIIDAIAKRDQEGYYLGRFEFVHKNGTKIPVELKNRLVEGEGGTINSLLSFHCIDTRIKTEKKFRRLFNASPNSIAVLDKNGLVQDLNESFIKLFGFEDSELMGKDLANFILKENQKLDYGSILNTALNGQQVELQTSRLIKNGQKIHVLLSITPVIEDKKVTALFCIYTDISNQVSAKKTIEKQLKEKEVLLHEIHHRVKNNLAIISGLIGLESMNTKNEALISQLEVTQSRIFSIAKIHELLYKHNDFVNIDFQEYTNEISTTFSQNSNIQFETLTSNSIYLNVNQAVPCGMLLHEITTQMISNARANNYEKHTIYYSLALNGNVFTIHICEQGHTNTFDFIKNEDDTLGSQLISVLLKQLKATIHLSGDNETCITISFKKREKKGAHSTLV